MSAELLSRAKRIRSDLQNAKSQLDSVTELLDQDLRVNNVYIEKKRIDELNNDLNKMLNTIKNKVIPAINVETSSGYSSMN